MSVLIGRTTRVVVQGYSMGYEEDPGSGEARRVTLVATSSALPRERRADPVEVVGDASTGINMGTGGRWFRFSYDGHEGTIAAP